MTRLFSELLRLKDKKKKLEKEGARDNGKIEKSKKES